MKLEWMGEYRELIQQMMVFANSYSRTCREEHNYHTSVDFTATEIQVMEYFLEHEEEQENMVGVAESLGITKSTFSKHVKKMSEKGLLEKYHTSDNRKNIIVRVSEFGKEVYQEYAKYTYETAFCQIFEILDKIPKKYVREFSRILELAAKLTDAPKEREKEQELIRIEE